MDDNEIDDSCVLSTTCQKVQALFPQIINFYKIKKKKILNTAYALQRIKDGIEFGSSTKEKKAMDPSFQEKR